MENLLSTSGDCEDVVVVKHRRKGEGFCYHFEAIKLYFPLCASDDQGGVKRERMTGE